MFCIQCGEKQVDDAAKICYKCNAPIPSKDAAKNISLPLPQEHRVVPVKKPPSPLLILGSGCLIVTFIIICAFIALVVCSDSSSNSSSSSYDTHSRTPTPSPTITKIQKLEEIDKASAISESVYRLSKDAVKERLKCPRTAKFPLALDDRVRIKRIGENLYTCIGYVDSQNSFGAMVRTSFSVTIRYVVTPGWFQKNEYRIFDVVINE